MPIILVLIVIAIVIAALVSVGRAVFGGTDQAPQTNTGRDALLDTSLGHSVQMTVRGPLVSNEQFHSYQITIDPSARTMTTYQGYLDQPIASKTYGNNVKAYEQFVYALDKANYMNGDELTGSKNDTRGICATGLVYEFSVKSGDSTVKHLWTSTCKGSPGSLKASVSQVGDLFRTQIPDAGTLLRGLDLGSSTTLSF
ncbi:MAG TPA: hypothetical protein VIQ80_03295 [Candidatus Saccharimonadales bacterium]